MNRIYESFFNEREVLALLQEESTQKQGFEMIVAQYSEQLYWQIRRMVLSHEDANDFASEHLYQGMDQYRLFPGGGEALLHVALSYCAERVPHFSE